MERLLTRSRVLLAFCCVLLLAALNRRDPMVYGMFLFLATITVLGGSRRRQSHQEVHR